MHARPHSDNPRARGTSQRPPHSQHAQERLFLAPIISRRLPASSSFVLARAYYDELRAKDTGHDDALRRVASRLTGILHGCVKTGREYDEAAAWSHRASPPQAA